MMKYSWKSRVYILISCLFFIALWQVSAIIIDNDIYIPRIQQVIKSIVEIVNEPDFFKIVLSSFYRTAISYILALGCSMILGVLSVVYPFFKYLLSPNLRKQFCYGCYHEVVLALVWFTKDSAPFVVGFAITFPILYEGVRNSIMQIDKKLIDMTEIYEVELIDKIKKIYFPVMKFYFMSIFVSTFSLTFKVVIAGEIHGQPKFGIGTHIQLEKVNFNVSGIFAWIIIIMFISLIFELINRFLQKKIYRWNK
ncbi:ABC transporter permease [Clostridium saccharobutylicum]|uniref:ABC transporter permease n=1 Tax=Clostridium saccharobutylicum TaxID=169679 RepID=UPI0007DF7CD0|nr:ABC transporter permease subunit [Clostridium saccharobutylicum]OAV38758.1 ABC-type transporter, integral membrane subunit [Clostridium saccharobutylicum DSM 13864]